MPPTWLSKLTGSRTTNEEEIVQPRQPGLRPLARAVAAFKQGGYNGDAEAFKDFIICQYDTDDYEIALGEEEAELAKSMTVEAYRHYASDFIDKAEEEVSVEKDDLDLKGMLEDEIVQWRDRDRERREAEREEVRKRPHGKRRKK